MSSNNQDNQNLNAMPDLSSQETNKMAPVSDDVLEKFGASKNSQETTVPDEAIQETAVLDAAAQEAAVLDQADQEVAQETSVQDAVAKKSPQETSVLDATSHATAAPDAAVKETSVLDATEVDSKKSIIDISDDKQIKEKKHRTFPLGKFFIVLIIAFFTCLAVYGIWNRWVRYDDQIDIVGTWKVAGTETAITIDKNKIYLNKDTVLDYTLDSGAKVIWYTIGQMRGSCQYRFSFDRGQIAFVESTDTNFISTAFADICWFSDYITCKMSGITITPAYTKEDGLDVDTENTGLEDIVTNGQYETILLTKSAAAS